jgi:hypothetical protein
LELRLPNAEFDPVDVKDARSLIEENIVQWISAYKQAQSPRPSTQEKDIVQ